jgi:hypothetical protein
MPRLDASPVTMSLAVPCLLLLCFLVFATYMSAQNGFTANELTTGITPGSSIDALWADGNDHRWKIAVTNSGSTTFTGDVAIWPCTTQTCQALRGLVGIHRTQGHTYNWSIYDSVPPMTATPVYQWVATIGATYRWPTT